MSTFYMTAVVILLINFQSKEVDLIYTIASNLLKLCLYNNQIV
jgi:hypothetical protein